MEDEVDESIKRKGKEEVMRKRRREYRLMSHHMQRNEKWVKGRKHK